VPATSSASLEVLIEARVERGPRRDESPTRCSSRGRVTLRASPSQADRRYSTHHRLAYTFDDEVARG